MSENRNSENKNKAINAAIDCTVPNITAAHTIDALYKGSLDFGTLVRRLSDSSEKVSSGNMEEVEAMLMSQANTLNAFSNLMLSQIGDGNSMQNIQAFSDIAMRAQNGCRKTLLALIELKNPKRTTFIKQQNNAVNQQINNSENLEQPANQLLCEASNATLDFGRTKEAISINSNMETLGEIYGCPNHSGEKN